MDSINWYRLELKDINTDNFEQTVADGLSEFVNKSRNARFVANFLIRSFSTVSDFIEDGGELHIKQTRLLGKLIEINKNATYEVPGIDISVMDSIADCMHKLSEFAYSSFIALDYHKDSEKINSLKNLLIEVLQNNSSYETLKSEMITMIVSDNEVKIPLRDSSSIKIYGFISILDKLEKGLES